MIMEHYILYEIDPNYPIYVRVGNNHYVSEFDSVEQARNSNCHGIYLDRTKYKIAKIQKSIIVLDENVDPPSTKEIQDNVEKLRYDLELKKELESFNITDPIEIFQFECDKRFIDLISKLNLDN